jgi:hypothetical protein
MATDCKTARSWRLPLKVNDASAGRIAQGSVRRKQTRGETKATAHEIAKQRKIWFEDRGRIS